ncbi:MAG: hypothetical protein M0Q94_12475 [Candidatus Cloacimonetes bacterium]|nr:hypothetical protein [Candidatus Cloacimonadota bacterium]
MKRTMIMVALMLVLVIGTVGADSVSSVGGEYIYRDGMSFGGLSSQNFGYFDSQIGYFIGGNAGFNLSGGTNWTMNLIAGPSFRYHFNETKMYFDAAAGLSLSGTWASDRAFEAGIGGSFGACYEVTEKISLLIGTSIGYDMLRVDLETGAIGFGGSFYCIPSMSVGFSY